MIPVQPMPMPLYTESLVYNTKDGTVVTNPIAQWDTTYILRLTVKPSAISGDTANVFGYHSDLKLTVNGDIGCSASTNADGSITIHYAFLKTVSKPGGNTGTESGNNNGGDTGNKPGNNSGNTAQPPKANTVLTDEKNQATYVVTQSGSATGSSAGAKNGEVTYFAPVNKNSTHVVIPDTVTIDGIKYKITSISKNAFKNNKKITKVTIGKNVKTIGSSAFSGCSKLKTVVFGKNVTTIGSKAFYNCKKLKSITLNAKLKTIGDKAFYKCTSLTRINIPGKVDKIGKQAFYGCKKLKNITISTRKLTGKNVGSKAFRGIHSKATIKVPKAKKSAYKKLLKSRGIGSKVIVK